MDTEWTAAAYPFPHRQISILADNGPWGQRWEEVISSTWGVFSINNLNPWGKLQGWI